MHFIYHRRLIQDVGQNRDVIWIVQLQLNVVNVCWKLLTARRKNSKYSLKIIALIKKNVLEKITLTILLAIFSPSERILDTYFDRHCKYAKELKVAVHKLFQAKSSYQTPSVKTRLIKNHVVCINGRWFFTCDAIRRNGRQKLKTKSMDYKWAWFVWFSQ